MTMSDSFLIFVARVVCLLFIHLMFELLALTVSKVKFNLTPFVVLYRDSHELFEGTLRRLGFVMWRNFMYPFSIGSRNIAN